MKIYKGKHLTIKYNKSKSLFVQKWNTSPKDIEDFKFEMLEYTNLYEKLRPKNTLWMQKNFGLIINDDLKKWIETNVNKPCLKYGNKNCAFVVAEDVLAHIETIDVFEKTNSSINVKHFATSDEAQKWFNEQELKSSQLNYNSKKAELNYKGLDKNGKTIIEFKSISTEITNTLKSIKGIFEENELIKRNIIKYSSLTPKEKEVLNYIIQGLTNKQISDLTFTSINTIRTHRNRIWKKLDIKHFRDCLEYKSFYNSNF